MEMQTVLFENLDILLTYKKLHPQFIHCYLLVVCHAA